MMKSDDFHSSMLLLSGTIANLRCYSRENDFILTQIQHRQIGVAAIAAAAMGMGAIGSGTAGMAGNSAEKADWLEFKLDGERKIQGWVWKMPLGTGDRVEVVAEHIIDNDYRCYAIRRVGDGLLAIYPHATAGRKAHRRNSIKIWMLCSIAGYFIPMSFFVMDVGLIVFLDESMISFWPISFILCGALFGVVAFRVSRKYVRFVRLAEAVFRLFGWPDVENIDLRRTSKESTERYDIFGFGEKYFRYKRSEDAKTSSIEKSLY